MMTRLGTLVLALALASAGYAPAQAEPGTEPAAEPGTEPVIVTSGEHDGFTRIALDFGHPVDWQMGRTTDGYQLRIEGEDPDYDLARVYQLIGRDRISALWADPDSGDLHLGVGCACHAMPFAFRPSIVVIDMKSGKPPRGSAFEDPLEPATVHGDTPIPAPAAPAAQSAPAYDWVGARYAPATGAAAVPETAPLAPLPVAEGLEPLRKALIEEMSRGAAAGLIDLTLPRGTSDDMVVGIASARINLGDAPNYVTHLGESSARPATAMGEACVTNQQLDLHAWAAPDLPVAAQMAEPMTGLVGEFDRPDPVALARAVRFHLYLGFGAEARALLRAFPLEEDEALIWESMGFILDNEADMAGAFRSQAACDTAAAMWAALSIDDLALEPAVNSKAIVRAFSALPPHLRRVLGPRLADQLLSISEGLAARSVRDAVTRLPGEKAPDVGLLEARLDLAEGDLQAAQARLAPLAEQPGPDSDIALAELVLALALDLKPVAPEQVDALAALTQERREGPDAQRFEAALTLGHAAAGQFTEAFAGLHRQPDLTDQVWNILSILGTDDALITHAVLAPGDLPPIPAAAAAERIADRLLGHGFVEQAAHWLALAPTPDPRLVARLALARRDGQAALAAVAGIDDVAAKTLKAQSLTLTGNHRAAANIYRAIGEEAAYWTAEGLAQDWPVLAEAGPRPWSDAAAALLSQPAPAEGDLIPPGPLAEARAIVATSEATRLAIAAVLADVPAPATPTQ